MKYEYRKYPAKSLRPAALSVVMPLRKGKTLLQIIYFWSTGGSRNTSSLYIHFIILSEKRQITLVVFMHSLWQSCTLNEEKKEKENDMLIIFQLLQGTNGHVFVFIMNVH